MHANLAFHYGKLKSPNGKPCAVIVTPATMATHASLRYADWEQGGAQQVDRASKGRIGYLHLRAMVARDINASARDSYANINKDGLIIDVRRNNGANIDSWIIEKLPRRAWAFRSSNGKRSAGAGVWLSDGKGLADNGMAPVAENGQFAADGGG